MTQGQDPAPSGRGQTLAYWGSTAVLALIIGGGAADIVQPPTWSR